MPWSTCNQLLQKEHEGGGNYFSTKTADHYWPFLEDCGRWGHVFATSAGPRSWTHVTHVTHVTPSSIVRRGQCDTKSVTFEQLLRAAFMADRLLWGDKLEPARSGSTSWYRWWKFEAWLVVCDKIIFPALFRHIDGLSCHQRHPKRATPRKLTFAKRLASAPGVPEKQTWNARVTTFCTWTEALILVYT